MHEMSKKKVIAITGSMGSGKSQVSAILSESYPVLDCDRVNEKLLEPGNEGYNQLIQLDWICLDENKCIDKKKMAGSMFSNPDYKKCVEGILHPCIFKKMDEWTSMQSSSPVFIEVPLLFEIQAQSHFDEIWCVYCDLDIALERLMKYRGFTRDEAMARINHQFDPERKKSLSNICIENNGSLSDLRKAIDKALEME